MQNGFVFVSDVNLNFFMIQTNLLVMTSRLNVFLRNSQRYFISSHKNFNMPFVIMKHERETFICV